MASRVDGGHDAQRELGDFQRLQFRPVVAFGVGKIPRLAAANLHCISRRAKFWIADPHLRDDDVRRKVMSCVAR